ALAVSPERDEELLAATAFGIFKSTDAGLTWRWRGRFMNATDVTYDPGSPRDAAAATSRGVVRSRDGGLTWRHDREARLDGEREEAAAVSVHIIESGEASGTVVAGTDDGRFFRRRDGGDEAVAVELGVRRAVIDTRLEVQGYPSSAAVPKQDELRAARDRFLTRLASASPDELLMEEVRVLALVALEAWLRGEDFFEEAPDVDLEDGLKQVVRHWARLQRSFINESAPSTLEIDPTGRYLAAVHHYDNGVEQRSELQIFNLQNVLLYDEESLAQVGPSRFWKELHAPHRRPEQMPPTFGAPVAGRFLAWDRTGSTVATAFDADALVLWGLPRQTTLASAVPAQMLARHVKGFRSPVAAAAFAPGGVHLGALDRDGRPYAVRLVDGGGDARPLAKEPPEGGARLLAMLDGGVLTFGDGGQVRFWPVGQALGGLEPELIREERGRFDHVDVDPAGRWVLAAVDGGEPARPERWSTMLLIPHRAGRPGQATVIGAGAFWSQARFSPDGGWLAISRREGTQVWKLSEEPQRFLNVDAGSPVRFSPDSRLVQVGRELYSLDGP
ncbi:MAG: hypothetical protein AAFY88_20060, partial [Acidobacteriota bacterium]